VFQFSHSNDTVTMCHAIKKKKNIACQQMLMSGLHSTTDVHVQNSRNYRVTIDILSVALTRLISIIKPYQ